MEYVLSENFYNILSLFLLCNIEKVRKEIRCVNSEKSRRVKAKDWFERVEDICKSQIGRDKVSGVLNVPY